MEKKKQKSHPKTITARFEQIVALDVCHERIGDGDAGALGNGDTPVQLNDLRLVRQAVDPGRPEEAGERRIRPALSRIDASLWGNALSQTPFGGARSQRSGT